MVAGPPDHDKRELGTRSRPAKIDDGYNPHYDRLVKNFTKLALHGMGAAKLQRAVELINPHLYTVEERIREQAKASTQPSRATSSTPAAPAENAFAQL